MRTRSKAVVSALLGFSASVFAADSGAGAEALQLAAATVDTSRGGNLLSALPAQFEAGAAFVLQLDGPMTPERSRRMQAAGIVLSDYLPSNAYIVELGGADPDALLSLNFVRWLGAFEPAWKLSPDIGHGAYQTALRQAVEADGNVAVTITLFEFADYAATLAELEAIVGLDVYQEDVLAGNAMVTATLPRASLGQVAALRGVQFVEDAPEVTLRNSTTRWIAQTNVNNSTTVYNNGIHGENQVVGVLDGKLNVNHCSFSDTNPIGPLHRKILAYNSSLGSDVHGTHVCGTAAGDSFDNTDKRGIAYLAKICYNTIPNFTESAIYSRLDLHHTQGARSHTNSWGNDGTVQYDSLCRGFDSFQYDNEESFVCLAVTNTSTLKNPENAKNLLAVGASQDTPNQQNWCTGGSGPTNDGRRKPEVYLPGCSTISSYSSTSCSTTSLTGTSMASPAVAGTALLVRQYFTDGYYPSGTARLADQFTPSAALLKAMLVNSAADMTGVSGYPSNREGWGRVLLENALHFPGDTRKLIVDDVFNDSGLSTGDTVEVPFEVLGASEQVRVTLVWTEPPASAGANPAYINNLDLEVVAANGNLYKGNVFSGGQSTTGGTADARNNVEQVHVSSPPTGAWIARIKATAVNVGTQGYSLVVTGNVEVDSGPACPGDLDGDNDIDLNDLSVLLAHYGTASGATYADGDLNGDGAVDLTDLAEMLAVFGWTCS